MKKISFFFALISIFAFVSCDPDSGFEEITDVSLKISLEKESYALTDEITVSLLIPFHFKDYDSYTADLTVEKYDSTQKIYVPTTNLSFLADSVESLSPKNDSSNSQENFANKILVLTKTDYSEKESADFNFTVKVTETGEYKFLVDIIADPESGYVYGVCHKNLSLKFTE